LEVRWRPGSHFGSSLRFQPPLSPGALCRLEPHILRGKQSPFRGEKHIMAQTGEKPLVTHARKERFAASYPENEPILSWLRKEAVEEVLEPELPIVDCHHHMWDHRGASSNDHPKAHDDICSTRVYKLPQILEDMNDGHNVVKTVFAECLAFFHGASVTGLPGDTMRPLGEVEYCQGVAALCDSGTYGNCRVCAGIVGTCDFHDPNVEQLLQAMVRSRNFRGTRASAWGPQLRNSVDDEVFCKGMALMEKHNLSYEWVDLRANGAQKALGFLKEIALKFPKVRIVMNHLGALIGPRLNPDAVERWKAGVADVGKYCPNVVVKCGGVQMSGNGWDYCFVKRETPIGSKELCEIMLPYYSHVIDCFGPQRCKFESNFPVDRNSCSHRVLYNMFKRIAAAKNLSAADKKAIFHDAASCEAAEGWRTRAG